jgi:hypothetical protein
MQPSAVWVWGVTTSLSPAVKINLGVKKWLIKQFINANAAKQKPKP